MARVLIVYHSFRCKVVAEPVLVQNRPDKAAAVQLKALGKTLAAAGGNRGTRVRISRLPRPPASAAIGNRAGPSTFWPNTCG